MKKIVIAVICVIVAIAISAGLIFLNLPEKSQVAVTSLHINSATIRLESDMSKRLSVTVNPEDADKDSYKLVSENEFVAVCEGENVIAVNEGETYVYAQSADGKIESNKVKVIVSNNIFNVAAKIILSAQDAQYLHKELSEEIKESKELLEPEENEETEELEDVEVTSQKASQIAETEINEVPETYETPAVTERNAEDVVYVTKSGSKFHLKSCAYAKEATAVSRSQAASDGKTPCKICEP